MESLKNIGLILRSSLSSFSRDNCLQYSAAVSFYALFSLAPTIFIAVHIAGIVISDEAVVAGVNRAFTSYFGPESSEGLMLLLGNIHSKTQNIFSLVASILVLLFSSTNLFIQLKGTFNKIFNVRLRKGYGFTKKMIDRLTALSIIGIMALALIISLFLDSMIISFSEFLSNQFTFFPVLTVSIAGNLFVFLIVFLAVLLLYSLLPDIKTAWPPVLKGSLVTALLLIKGKILIGWIISMNSVTELNGASGSVIVLMLWIYYSSAILFFGVELVKTQLKALAKGITPNKYAIAIRHIRVDEN
ncbi:MAG: YihY/virulence factor BrkB family protein [Balneolaceae bacterium]|nr:YihY/virulence factor BrkB family protein [Balneolaceae bacterium]